MFAVTPEEMMDVGGSAPDPSTVSMRPEPSFFSKESPFWQIGASVAQGKGSELGGVFMGQRFLHEQSAAIRKYDPEFANSLRGSYGALPDVESGMFSGNAQIGTWAAHLGNIDPQKALEETIDDQKRIEAWKKSHPDITDVPSVNEGISRVKSQQDTIDEEAQAANEKATGVTLPLLGKVSGVGLAAGMAGSFSPSNPITAISNIFFGAGGLGKEVIANAGGRVAASAAANGVVSAVSQSVLAAPLAEEYGTPRNYKEEAYSALSNMLLGGILSGVHEAGEHYFPSTTLKGMQEVKGAVSEVSQGKGPISDAINEISAAPTPDAAHAVAAEVPLETKLDALHAVSPNPSAEERGVLQAGERDLLLDKGFQKAGVQYPEGMRQASEVEKAIEAGQPIPETRVSSLPRELAGAKPRYGYQEKQFTVSFESDIDKALYITAQKTPSKMDSAYRQFLKQNGLNDSEIATQGSAIRERIKAIAKNAEPGNLHLASQSKAKTTVPGSPKQSAQYPVLNLLRQKGGVRIGSTLDEELRAIGVSPKTAPGLFKKSAGLTDVDNFPKSEWKFGTAPSEDGNYVDRQYILDSLRNERFGKTIKGEGADVKIAPGSEEDLAHYAHSLGIETEGTPLEIIEKIRTKEAELEASRIESEIGDRMLTEETERVKSETERGYQEILRKMGGEDVVSKGPGTENEPQEEMFKNLKPEDVAPISEKEVMSVKDAIEDIKDQESLLRAMTTCFTG